MTEKTGFSRRSFFKTGALAVAAPMPGMKLMAAGGNIVERATAFAATMARDDVSALFMYLGQLKIANPAVTGLKDGAFDLSALDGFDKYFLNNLLSANLPPDLTLADLANQQFVERLCELTGEPERLDEINESLAALQNFFGLEPASCLADWQATCRPKIAGFLRSAVLRQTGLPALGTEARTAATRFLHELVLDFEKYDLEEFSSLLVNADELCREAEQVYLQSAEYAAKELDNMQLARDRLNLRCQALRKNGLLSDEQKTQLRDIEDVVAKSEAGELSNVSEFDTLSLRRLTDHWPEDMQSLFLAEVECSFHATQAVLLHKPRTPIPSEGYVERLKIG